MPVKQHIKGAPSKVNELYERIRKKNPKAGKEYAARVAWSIYCQSVNPNYKGCGPAAKTPGAQSPIAAVVSALRAAADQLEAGAKLRAARQIHVSVRELPPVLQRALANIRYGRKDIAIEAATGFTLQDTNWSGGTRGFDVLVNLKTGDYSQGSAGRPGERHELPDGFVLIQGSEGGGNPVYAVLVVNPSTLAPLLPQATETLEPQEQTALDIIGSLTSSYRAEEFQRKRLGKYNAQNPIVQSLVAKGLLKTSANGAITITTKGKNAKKSYY